MGGKTLTGLMDCTIGYADIAFYNAYIYIIYMTCNPYNEKYNKTYNERRADKAWRAYRLGNYRKYMIQLAIMTPPVMKINNFKA